MTTARSRRHFPMVSTCTHCACKQHRRAGSSRSGDVQYRRCAKCSTRYKVFPIAIEEDLGGLVSVIRPL